MSFDPKSLGARCDECWLNTHRDGGPVPSEHHESAIAALVGEAPGETEVAEDRPFVGSSGRELMNSLGSLGYKRPNFSYVNALACRPVKNELDLALHRVKQENKRRAKAGLNPLPSPIDCCRPRLEAELQAYSNIVTLGGTALRATLGNDSASVMGLRGGPIEKGGRRIMPSLHPSFVMRARRWTRAFRQDLGKALRWFGGDLNWQDPTTLYKPTPAQLEEFLRQPAEFLAFDYETDGLEPMVCRVRCVSIGTPSAVALVPILSIDGVCPFYSEADEREIKNVLRTWFVDKSRLKVGHNAGYYDRMVTRAWLGVDPTPLCDTILLHRSAESELPHNLGYVGSIYTDVTAWKADHAATEAKTDVELHAYAVTDAAVTARIVDPLWRAVNAREQLRVVERDHKLQKIAVGMHETGLYIDQEKRKDWDRKLLREARTLRAQISVAVGRDDFNPASVPQLRDQLFERWHFPVNHYTDKGDPSTDDEALRLWMIDRSLPEEHRRFCADLRKYRRATKLRGTYVVKLRPAAWGEIPWDPYAEEDEEQEEKDKKKVGLVLADGRLHPDFNAHGTTSGRFSSSRPNAQNFPKKLCDMIVPQPGNIFVGADKDQVELRVVAAVAGMQKYLDVFNTPGGDPHALTAEMIYGDAFRHATGDNRKTLRKFAKTVQFASLYGANDETVHNNITKAEDDDGNLVNANLSVRETAAIHQKWLLGVPELVRWWDQCVQLWQRQGYLQTYLWKRRRDFLDGEDRNEMVNFPIQGTAAEIVHEATIQIVDQIPFGKWGPGTGLCNQVHDAILLEVPVEHADWAVSVVNEAMGAQRFSELPGITFTSVATKATSWKKA